MSIKKISLKNLVVAIAAVIMLQGFVSCNSAKKQAPAEEKVLLPKNLLVCNYIPYAIVWQ